MTAASYKPLLLIACDEPPVIGPLRNLLACNYRVLEAVDGIEALASIECDGLDLALLKPDLPGISGLDIVKRVRQGGLKLPLVLLLNRREKRRVAKAFALGASDYLLSPFPADQVLERVAAAIRPPIEESCSVASFGSGELTVDLGHRAATVRGEALQLTSKEYAILRLLAEGAPEQLHCGRGMGFKG